MKKMQRKSIDSDALVKKCLKTFTQSTSHAFSKALDATAKEMFAKAESASSNQEEQVLLEQYNILLANTGHLVQRFQTFCRQMPRGILAQLESDDFSGSLSLVDDEALEVTLAFSQLETRLEVRQHTELFPLEKRLRIVFRNTNLDKTNMPFGPAAISWVCGNALELAQLSASTKVSVVSNLTNRLQNSAKAMYKEINSHLIAAGILPNYKPDIKPPASRTKQEPARQDNPAAIDGAGAGVIRSNSSEELQHGTATMRHTGFPPPGEQPLGAGIPGGSFFGGGDRGETTPMDGMRQNRDNSPVPQPFRPSRSFLDQAMAGFSSRVTKQLFDILAQRHSAASTAAGQAQPPTGGFIKPNVEPVMLDRALEKFTGHASELPVGYEGVQRLKKQALSDIKNQTGLFYPKLGAYEESALEVMGRILDEVRQAEAIDPRLVQGVGQVQVPLMRVAINEPAFFDEPAHPARQFMETMIYAAQQWYGSPVVEELGKFSQLVLHQFDGTSHAFAEAGEDLRKFLQQAETKAKKAESKWIRAAQGREKLELAREEVEQLISRHRRPDMAEFLKNLLELVVKDSMTLTLLREGADSPRWKMQVKAVQALVSMTDPGEAGQISRTERQLAVKELGNMMDQLGFSARDRQVSLRNLDKCAQWVESTREAPAPEPDYDEVSAFNPLSKKRKARQQKKKLEDLRPLTDEENAMLARLRLLPFGSLFDFIQNQQMDKIRYRLSWLSPVSNKALFVTLTGTAPMERTLPSLAIDMVRGNVIYVKPVEKGFFERVMRKIVQSLRLDLDSTKHIAPAG